MSTIRLGGNTSAHTDKVGRPPPMRREGPGLATAPLEGGPYSGVFLKGGMEPGSDRISSPEVDELITIAHSEKRGGIRHLRHSPFLKVTVMQIRQKEGRCSVNGTTFTSIYHSVSSPLFSSSTCRNLFTLSSLALCSRICFCQDRASAADPK